MSHTTLVIGSGECAARVAEMLVAAGIEVVVAADRENSPDAMRALESGAPDNGVELLVPARLAACNGFAGDFEAVLEVDRTPIRRKVASIVIAEDCRRHANFDLYGLTPTAGVRSLTEFKKHVSGNSEGETEDFTGKIVAYLNGLAAEGIPSVFEEILRTAVPLQALPDTRTVVLSVNLKVAANGLEALYREAKDVGTLFFKFKDSLPTIRQRSDGRTELTFKDESSGHACTLAPDVTVVDERPVPSDDMAHLGRILGLHTDGVGFLQTENVHRYTAYTNRKGILVCGTTRGPLGPADFESEAAEAVTAVLGLIHAGGGTVMNKARIDTGQCIKCLTCYRLCPYRAIHKGLHMTVNTDACEGCGICAAECPRGAIELADGDHPSDAAAPGDVSGSIVAFCCSRSAARAKELAEVHGLALPQRLKIVEIPCSGGLSLGHMLAPLADGADGVLVLSCHEGNCHSETGNILARRRVSLLSTQLEQMDRLSDRLEIHTLAANMACEFAQIVRAFDEKISAAKVSGSSPHYGVSAERR